ncbi:hypothetical protein D3C84_1319950 [compost metagenome]
MEQADATQGDVLQGAVERRLAGRAELDPGIEFGAHVLAFVDGFVDDVRGYCGCA